MYAGIFAGESPELDSGKTYMPVKFNGRVKKSLQSFYFGSKQRP